MVFLLPISKIKKEELIHYNTADKDVSSIFIIFELKKKGGSAMKKKAEQTNKNASQQENQGTMGIEKLKYEVGQEMGIKPKTKNKKS